MPLYNFKSKIYYNTFATHSAGISISSGDEIVTSIVDAHGKAANNEVLAHSPNPLTGPIYVEGAEPGDSISIKLESLLPNRSNGWSYDVIKSNLLEPMLAAKYPERSILDWEIDLSHMIVKRKNIINFPVLPLQPVLGCIGVAPPLQEAITSYTCGNFGGNMDYQGIVEGVTVHLPVFVDGALLFVGDGHAYQSSGEVTGSGVETSFDLKMKISLNKNYSIRWPRVENDQYIITLGNAQPLEKAIQAATSEMICWLANDWNLDYLEGSQLMSQIVEYEPGNLVSREYTMACKIPKRYLPEIKLG
jgi:amidase